MKRNALICLFTLVSTLPLMAQSSEQAKLQVNKESDSLAIAEQLYSQSLDQSLTQLERQQVLKTSEELFAKFVLNYPKSEFVSRAQYLQATCLMELGKHSKANQMLGILANKNQGEYAAAAAYKLASLASEREEWSTATGYYQIVVQKTQRQVLSNDARFRLAKALQMQNKLMEAQQVYEQILTLPQLDASINAATLFTLAQIKTKQGENQSAYDLFNRFLALPQKDAASESSAILQMARLASKLGKSDEAENYYAQISQMQGMEVYKAEAQLEQILTLYKAKDYKGILASISKELIPMTDPRQQANRDLIIGQAMTELKHYQEAEAYFESAEKLLPGSLTALEAAYRRIVASQLSGSASCFILAEKYIKTYCLAAETADNPLNDLVRLLYANHLMYVDIEAAVRQFEAIRLENIPLDVRPMTEYSKAWCASKSKSGSIDPVEVLDHFIASYPEHDKMPEALVLRASCLVKAGRLNDALKNFDEVIEHYSDAAASAVSWQSAAQACATAKRTEKMIYYYEGLIKNCPLVKAEALAEAHFNLARAFYQERTQEAVDHFISAAKLDPKRYSSTVAFNLVQCYFKLQQHENLQNSLVALSKSNPKAYGELPASIFRWCGWENFQNKNYAKANLYLTASLNREEKESYTTPDGQVEQRPKVEPIVWKILARTRLELMCYKEGLEAAEHYVDMETLPYRKAEGMRDQAQLLIGLHRCDEAIALAEKAIEMGVDGPLKSSLFVTLGDARFVNHEFTEAAKFYGRTANIVSDKTIKPIALYKIIAALEQAGKNSEAAIYQETLRSEFPDWQPSAQLRIFIQDALQSPPPEEKIEEKSEPKSVPQSEEKPKEKAKPTSAKKATSSPAP